MRTITAKERIGALLYDGPAYLRSLRFPNGWIHMRNRNDRLMESPDGLGMRCDWEYSRPLHICDVFPFTSELLLRKACQQWPVCLSPEQQVRKGIRPNVSFVIGHRGMKRLPHLLATLRSIRGQEMAEVECIVVEQDAEPLIRDRLPGWVRYKHAPQPDGEIRYNRSAAFNEGTRYARGNVLILHDGDLIAPSAYAGEVWKKHKAGYEVMRLHRFIFYAGQSETDTLFSAEEMPRRLRSEQAVENAVGGSLAVSSAVYESLGRMDEDFVGWGGEDNEFWDRCLTRKVWDFGYLPFIHLWHSSLADRRNTNPALSLLVQKRLSSVSDRIQTLCARWKGSSAPVF